MAALPSRICGGWTVSPTGVRADETRLGQQAEFEAGVVDAAVDVGGQPVQDRELAVYTGGRAPRARQIVSYGQALARRGVPGKI